MCNSTDMLLCDIRGHIYIGYYDDQDEIFKDDNLNEIYEVSHFMYLSEVERPEGILASTDPKIQCCLDKLFITNDDCFKYLLEKQERNK